MNGPDKFYQEPLIFAYCLLYEYEGFTLLNSMIVGILF